MLRTILWRELFDHLQSLRFAIGFVLIVGLFVISAVSWNVRHARESATYGTVKEKAERGAVATARGGGYNLTFGVELWRPPSAVGFLAGGQDRGMPNYAWAGLQGLRLEHKGDRNPLLFRRDIDWSFIIGFLGTLLALLLTHDGIAGEKERGSLRQTLASAVPRDLLLLGKYLAASLAVAIPVLVGAGLALLVMVHAGETELSARVCGPVVSSLLGGFLCLSASVWLGLFISSRTSNASLALMVALVVWALFAVFLPGSGSLIGNKLVPVSTRSDLQRDLNQVWREHGEGHEAVVARLRENYWRQLLRQLEVAQNATQLSPITAYRCLGEALSSTGVTHYRTFLDQADAYRKDVLSFAAELDQAPDVRARAEEVPVFRFREAHLTERLAAATDRVVILLLYNLLFFAGALISFRRYDVR